MSSICQIWWSGGRYCRQCQLAVWLSQSADVTVLKFVEQYRCRLDGRLFATSLASDAQGFMMWTPLVLWDTAVGAWIKRGGIGADVAWPKWLAKSYHLYWQFIRLIFRGRGLTTTCRQHTAAIGGQFLRIWTKVSGNVIRVNIPYSPLYSFSNRQ